LPHFISYFRLLGYEKVVKIPSETKHKCELYLESRKKTQRLTCVLEENSVVVDN
jgi:hypothetical protein